MRFVAEVGIEALPLGPCVAEPSPLGWQCLHVIGTFEPQMREKIVMGHRGPGGCELGQGERF